MVDMISLKMHFGFQSSYFTDAGTTSHWCFEAIEYKENYLGKLKPEQPLFT